MGRIFTVGGSVACCQRSFRRKGWIVLARLFWAAVVLLASLGLPSIGYGQTADPDLSWVTDSRWQDIGTAFANPCRGFENAFRRLGIPLSANPTTSTRYHHSWEIMLPMLAQVANDATLAADADAILNAIDQQVRNGNAYSPNQARQVLSSLQDWSNTVVTTLQNNQAVPPGYVIVAATILADDTGPYWQRAAGGSGLPSAMQYMMSGNTSTVNRDRLTCGGYSQDHAQCLRDQQQARRDPDPLVAVQTRPLGCP